MTSPTEPTPAPAPSRGGTATPPPAPPVTDTPPGWGPGWRSGRRARRDSGSVFFGVVLLLIGGYFLLRDTLHIRLPSFGELWPIALVALGILILVNARRDDRL
jgi:uncharacterized membrane protein